MSVKVYECKSEKVFIWLAGNYPHIDQGEVWDKLREFISVRNVLKQINISWYTT